MTKADGPVRGGAALLSESVSEAALSLLAPYVSVSVLSLSSVDIAALLLSVKVSGDVSDKSIRLS